MSQDGGLRHNFHPGPCSLPLLSLLNYSELYKGFVEGRKDLGSGASEFQGGLSSAVYLPCDLEQVYVLCIVPLA